MKEGMRVKERGKAILQAIKKNRTLALDPNRGYGKEESDWFLYDCPLQEFGETFFSCLPNNGEYSSRALKEYIEKTLSLRKTDDLTAVEFGGPGSKLFSGFTIDFFKKTLGVCLEDIRNTETRKTDRLENHSVVVGDILDVLDDKVFKNITATLGTNKTDLIISRMMGPLTFISKDPAILDRIIRKWYEMLSENGLMFIQFDFIHYDFKPIEKMVKTWANLVKEKFPEIDIQIGNGVMRLNKKTGAPESLPPATQLFK